MADILDWAKFTARHIELGEALLEPSLDHHKRQAVQREYGMLSGLLAKHTALRSVEEQLQELALQRASASQELIDLIDEESLVLRKRYEQVQKEIDALLFPPDELDERDVFLEVRPGTGGQEAALFVGDLMRMYLLFATRQNWDASVVSATHTDLGGYREVVIHIRHKGAYGLLKRESGVHRVQRVPATETAGRIHTSTATVAVLPEAHDIEVSIDPKDVRVDVYRSSGAGGQHVNTTDSAVRVTHIPTGLVVACQDERSQHKNKARALKVLQARLRSAYEAKKVAEESEQRKKLIGSGERAEKVRTYNVPQNRITDHQVNLTLKNLDMVLEGHLETIIDALAADDQIVRRSQPLDWFMKA